MNPRKAYIVAMTFQLNCIGIKYGIPNATNPFQESTRSPAVLLFLVALFPHVIANMLDKNKKTTIITLHVSGLVGCEALLHIFLGSFYWYCIINLFLLLLILFLGFFDYVIDLLLRLFSYASRVLQSLFNCTTTAAPSDGFSMPDMMETHPNSLFDYASHLLDRLFNRITNAAPSNDRPMMPNMDPHLQPLPV
ncbi:hypothetical protein Fmac_014052 [Flemingia macrophylla]|uniref:Uncharacterized protein n=1 Tax=Flemingia macrophylla TaxID=520843 RepID=A0ABD1MAM9_9FABA